MFNCGMCQRSSAPGESAEHVVLATREKVYPKRLAAHANGNDDPGGRGIEIVKEVLAHKGCV